MIRRIVCLMLVPALLANQAVLCCAHTHSGSEPSDHSTTRAHVHQSGHSHDSGHYHHGDSGDHQHDDSNQSENSTPIAEWETGNPNGHNDDAIYLSDQVDLHLPMGQISIEESIVAAQWLIVENPPTLKPSRKSQVTRAGPLGLYSIDQCAIFLQTCRLLI